MTTYVAFLRAINVAGHAKVTKDELKAAFTSAGCRGVQTYIQIFWRAQPNMAVRWGKWKMWKVKKTDLSEPLGGKMLPQVEFGLDTPMGQLTVLYDLSADISEQRNVADENPQVVERLESELKTWNAELSQPLWPSNRSILHDLDGQMVQLFF